MLKSKFYIVFFLVLIILFALLFRISKTEHFGSNSANAFDMPLTNTLKKWTFPQSYNWYKLKKSEPYKFTDIGFTTPNYKISISFLLMILNKHGQWRNIFRFSNKSDGKDGDDGRVPGLWIWPNDTKLHFRFKDNNTWNNGIDSDSLPIGITMLITYVIDGNTIYFYLNNVLAYTGNFINVTPRNSNSVFFINDGCCDGNTQYAIKNLTFYDGVLTQTDVDKIYDSLESNRINSSNQESC
jgi:hypothetical protein